MGNYGAPVEIGVVAALAFALIEIVRQLIGKVFGNGGGGSHAKTEDLLGRILEQNAQEALIRKIEQTSRETIDAVERLETPIREMEAHLRAIRYELSRNGKREK